MSQRNGSLWSVVEVIETDPVERLRGRISEVLRCRLDRLSDEDAAVLCSEPTLGEAVVAAIALLHGAQAFVVQEPYEPGTLADLRSSRAYYSLHGVVDVIHGNPQREAAAPDRIVSIHLTQRHADTWANTALAASPRTCTALRLDMLHQRFEECGLLLQPINVRITKPYPVMFAHPTWSDLSAAIILWWQARIRAGYTPQAAATMLHLVLDPSVHSQITVHLDGSAPSLAPPPHN